MHCSRRFREPQYRGVGAAEALPPPEESGYGADPRIAQARSYPCVDLSMQEITAPC